MGKYSCEQNNTLNTALRTHLGAKGWVMSDWRATHSTSILDGLDQQMPGDSYMDTGTAERCCVNQV
jgi:beta-glucosidase